MGAKLGGRGGLFSYLRTLKLPEMSIEAAILLASSEIVTKLCPLPLLLKKNHKLRSVLGSLIGIRHTQDSWGRVCRAPPPFGHNFLHHYPIWVKVFFTNSCLCPSPPGKILYPDLGT